MAKRIHELAKEWGLTSKELLARIAELGITGKRSQSVLADTDMARLEMSMGRASESSVRVGGERVVGERVVTESDGGGEVTTRERIVEARVRPNVIRRRKKTVEVITQKAATVASEAPAEEDGLLDLPDLPSVATQAPARTDEENSDALLGAAFDADNDSSLLDLPEIAPAATVEQPEPRERCGQDRRDTNGDRGDGEAIGVGGRGRSYPEDNLRRGSPNPQTCQCGHASRAGPREDRPQEGGAPAAPCPNRGWSWGCGNASVTFGGRCRR